MRLVIIGYRGTGKTSTAKILAERFHTKYLSTDELIISKTGIGIPEIVAKNGWDYFRQIESEVIKEIINEDDCIIDAGGGAILSDENIKNLKKNSKIILLKAEPDIIAQRIKDDTERPSLTGKSITDEIEDVLNERKMRYEKSADFSVDTTKLTANETAEKIIDYLKS